MENKMEKLETSLNKYNNARCLVLNYIRLILFPKTM